MNVALVRPVLERLLRDTRLEISLTGKLAGRGEASAVRRMYGSFGYDGARVERFVRNAVARIRAWDLYLSPDFHLTGKRARAKVHLFHGVSFRNVAVSKRARRFDRLFLIGEYMRRRFIELKILPEGDPRCERVGMPKVDCLVDGSLDVRAIRERLSLDPTRPTVLYAPTWTEKSSLYTMAEALLKGLGREPVNVLVKLHDNSYDPRKNSIDWERRMPEILPSNARLVRDFDSSPSLAASDLLVSDASSVSNEYLLLDRPIVFADVPELFHDWRGTDLETWGRKVGRIGRTPKEVIDLVREELASPRSKSEIRRAAADDLFYSPGTATARAVDAVYRALDLEARSPSAASA